MTEDTAHTVNGRIRAAVLVFAAVGALSACGGGSHEYPAQARSNFLSSCQSSARKSGASQARAQSFCRCVLTGAEEQISYTDFKRIDTQVALGGTSNLPPKFIDVVSNCR